MIGHVIFAIEDGGRAECHRLGTFDMSSALRGDDFHGTESERLIQIGIRLSGYSPEFVVDSGELDIIATAKQCIGPNGPDYHSEAADAVYRVSRAEVEQSMEYATNV